MQQSHDNNNGDPVFSVFFRYGCDGPTSSFCDPGLDAAVLRASGLAGPERVKAWEEVFRTLHDDLVPYLMLFHMVDYTRVSQRIEFVPDASTGSEVRVQEITFN